MRIEVINPAALGKAIKSKGRGENVFAWISGEDFYAPAFRTRLDSIPDVVKPNWPRCCPLHRSLETNITDYLRQFPNCCTLHARLNTPPSWYDREKFVGDLPAKILETARQTENLWAAKIEEPDWYEHITEFLEYAYESFGQLPEGYGAPIALNVYTAYLRNMIERAAETYPDKVPKLLAFLKSYESPKGKAKPTDVNELIVKYDRWMKEFPWHISYLAHLKPHFENQLPILNGAPIYNRYSGISKARIITEERMIEYIISATTMILQAVNVKALQDKQLLTEPDKKQIELINARRDHELRQLGQNFKDERAKVNRILKQWYSGEIRYLKDMAPFLQKMDDLQPEARPSKTTIAIDLDKIENVFCRQMPISEVKAHFLKLTRSAKNGKPFLAEEQVYQFIARAFGGNDKLPKQRINYGHGEKRLVISLFAEFFTTASREYEPSAHCKLKYIKLLSDHFEGWPEKQVQENFKVVAGAWNA
ncbi:hypothetical protein [Chitinophaga sp. CB10]|uniref:hypothetical protein n=1 Tax=Chitinophaga sp. CB10 TaxID=1891659 RepID=UPI0025BD1ACB|nr:hypothetical protein [Chitinophaga sp. CB10]